MEKVIIKRLDSGYTVQLENEDEVLACHATSSNDGMIARVRELFGINRKAIINKAVCEKKKNNHPTYGILTELPGKWPIKKSEQLVPEVVPIPNNDLTKYAETLDGRLLIEYRTNKIYTNWDEISKMVLNSTPKYEMEVIPTDMSSNSRTAIRQFMIATRDYGVVPGLSVELDPDKDYRLQLNRNSMPEYERGTLETVESPT